MKRKHKKVSKIRKICKFAKSRYAIFIYQVKDLLINKFGFEFKLSFALYRKHHICENLVELTIENYHQDLNKTQLNAFNDTHQIYEIPLSFKISLIEEIFSEILEEDKLVFYKTNQREKRIKEILCS